MVVKLQSLTSIRIPLKLVRKVNFQAHKVC